MTAQRKLRPLAGRLTFPAWILVALLAALTACSRQDAPPQPPSPVPRAPEVVPEKYINGAVTCALPKHWKFKGGSTGSDTETKNLYFLGMAGQGRSIFAQVLITADHTPQPPSVEQVVEYQRTNFKIPKDNETVVDDVTDGHWRTLISSGKLDDIPAVILDRHGVENGIIVTLRVMHPVSYQNNSAMIRAVAEFNAVATSLQINGTNSHANLLEIVDDSIRIRRPVAQTADGNPAAPKSFPLFRPF